MKNVRYLPMTGFVVQDNDEFEGEDDMTINEQMDEMTAGELCDLIDAAVEQLTQRNREARENGADELWPATTGYVTALSFYTSVPPSKRRKK